MQKKWKLLSQTVVSQMTLLVQLHMDDLYLPHVYGIIDLSAENLYSRR